MNNATVKIGEHKMRNFTIDIVTTEPCYRISQYGMGVAITCSCTICKKRGQSPEESKVHMDKVYAQDK